MAKNIPLNQRIIFALDVSSKDDAERWLIALAIRSNSTRSACNCFWRGGFPAIEMILNRGCQVMVDLKFFDIPETVALAVRELRDKGATFITVHGNDPPCGPPSRNEIPPRFWLSRC